MPDLKAVSGDCAACNKPLPKREFMLCATCKGAYDLECINLSPQRFYSFYKHDKKRRDNWKCPECVSRTPKVGNQNTPVRSAISPEQVSNVTCRIKPAPQENPDCSVDNTEEIAEISTESLTELKQFCVEMRAIRTEMTLFRSAITDLTAAVKAQTSRLDTLETRVENLEVKISDPVCCRTSDLEETFTQMKLEIEEGRQERLANDVEITNFPECGGGENATHIVLTIAKKLGVTLDEREVVSAARVGLLRAPVAAADGGDAGFASDVRPRPISVRLARRVTRDELLRAARVRRHLTTDDMNVAGIDPVSRPFYINERLTRHKWQLFRKTREVAKRLSWRYVWTRDGRIFARQESGKACHRLRAESDLDKVFGEEAVSKAAGNTE